MAWQWGGSTARYLLATLVVTGLLGACTPENMKPTHLAITDDGGGAPVGGVLKAELVPAGDFSLTTVRRRVDVPGDNAAREILCTAPSPDWATALAKATQVAGSGSAPGGPSASLSISNSLSETISALAGRTAGVVALRDGLYKACEAYANGVIGKDAYALIVSQYGNLLVALAGNGTSSGTITAAIAQLSIVEALLVSCISAADTTVPMGGAPNGNPLLWDVAGNKPTQACTELMQTIATQAKALMTPAPADPAKPTTPGPWTVSFTVRATPAPDASATITTAAAAILAAITKDSGAKVTVTGNADAGGTAAENRDAALARAAFVLHALGADGVSAANLAPAVDGSAVATAPRTRTATITLAGSK